MGLNYPLDVKDRKILAELDANARRSNSEIGKKVRLSKEVVKYRIDRLQQQGVIVRFHTIVNYFRIGLHKYKLYLRLTNISKEKREEIAQYFHNHAKTEWAAIMTGRWDIIAGFIVASVNEFDAEVQQVLTLFSLYIQEKAVTTTLYLVHETRGFLKGKDTPGIVYHTSKDTQIAIDSIDKSILKWITNNARMPVTEIAQKLHLTARIVQYRLKELERKKIILAYRVHLEPKSMGRIFCKLIVYMANATEKRLQQFIYYVSSLPGAIWPQRVMGAWDFELDLELENYDQFQEVILDLKEKFSDIIRNHEFCITSKEYKLDLFPGAERN